MSKNDDRKPLSLKDTAELLGAEDPQDLGPVHLHPLGMQALADMDFEAPGLDSKFTSLSPEDCWAGMIDQFHAFQSETPLPDIGAVEIPLPDDVAAAGGSLCLIPAGN